MKTEHEIAKENIGVYNKVRDLELSISHSKWVICNSHKQTCQRFLDFLNLEIENTYDIKNQFFKVDLDRKITDLKNAIKEYDDNGI